jgi:Tfp pilus assembly protein PilX
MKPPVHKGQVLLITVLVLSIAITIALSLIGRSVTDVSMSRNLEESARAFGAAEAGIEEALRTKQGRINPLYAAGVGYQSDKINIGGGTGLYTLPTIIVGQADTIWLVSHDASEAIDDTNYYSGTIDICWKGGPGQTPALEVAIYYRNGGSYFVTRGFYDPSDARWPVEDPTNSEQRCGGMTDVYRQSVTMSVVSGDVPMFMRIRPYHGNATVSIAARSDSMPTQGFEYSSVGCTQISETSGGCTEGGVTRKIVVRRQYSGPATIFDYSIYSQGAFVH